MKRFSLALLILCITTYVCLLAFDLWQNATALNFASHSSEIIRFDAKKYYLRINGVVDAFLIPSLFWSKNYFVFLNGLPIFSRDPIIKAVYLSEEGKPKLLLLKFDSSTKYAHNQQPFDSNQVSPYQEIPANELHSQTLTKGAKIKPSVVTGAPAAFPKDGMTITEGMRRASLKGSSNKYYEFLVNDRQLSLENTLFVADYVFIYDSTL